jgi:hypothetical protein
MQKRKKNRMVASKNEDIFVKDNDKIAEPTNATKWYSNTYRINLKLT